MGSLFVGFNLYRVPAYSYYTYLSGNCMLGKISPMLFFRHRILLNPRDWHKHLSYSFGCHIIRFIGIRDSTRVESNMNLLSVIDTFHGIKNVNKGMGFWSTPDCISVLVIMSYFYIILSFSLWRMISSGLESHDMIVSIVTYLPEVKNITI